MLFPVALTRAPAKGTSAYTVDALAIQLARHADEAHIPGIREVKEILEVIRGVHEGMC